MDAKDLEEKLEKDNLTLKEHIFKLQNTIKNIKSELGNTNVNTTYVNTLSQIDISTIKNSKLESPKNNGKGNLKEDSDDEINNLKFSFKNIKAEHKLLEENKRKREAAAAQYSHDKKEEDEFPNRYKINPYNNIEKDKALINNNNNNEKSTNNIHNSNNKNHIYKDNFSKLKNEKDIIEKMENVRSSSNLKKKYDNLELDVNLEYEKFQKLNSIKPQKYAENNEETIKDSEGFYRKSKIDTIGKNPDDRYHAEYYLNTNSTKNNNNKYNNDSFNENENYGKYNSANNQQKGLRSDIKSNVDTNFNNIPRYKNSKIYLMYNLLNSQNFL